MSINKVNNKKYIGLSANDSKNNMTYYGSGVLLQKAIKKYGKHNFYKIILEDNVENFQMLCERERFYIKKYNAVESKYFYNIEEGGISTSFWNTSSEEKKNLIKGKISKALKQHYINNPISKETIERLINGLHKYNLLRIEKEFKKYDDIYVDDEFDKFIIFKKLRKNSFKLWVKDKIDVLNYIKKYNKLYHKNQKHVYKFDKDGKFICKYNSGLLASREFNMSKGNLSSAVNGYRNFYAGFRWSFNDKPNDLLEIKKTGRKKGVKNSYKIVRNHVNIIIVVIDVYDENMNLMFSNTTYEEISNKLNLSCQMVAKSCRGERMYKGYFFKRIGIKKETKIINNE